MTAAPALKPLDPAKFRDPAVTAKGEPRASVALRGLQTLWFNTGTLCNIACHSCYIESSPENDRLAYLALADVTAFLDEIARERLPVAEIGFTGGEPFMNPEILAMLDAALARGHAVLMLTNAMRPLLRPRIREGLLALKARHGGALSLRVSLDHYRREIHEAERGAQSFAKTLAGLRWLAGNAFSIAVAGRHFTDETDASLRAGYARLFAAEAIPIDAEDPHRLVLFPEMDAHRDVPEITTSCWSILGKDPGTVMCATSRMVVKRKGAARPEVLACTLIPYDDAFSLGATLAEAHRSVPLNHPHCAKFCVLGGASCSA